jgi:sialic acid synthase SpsE
MNTSFSIGTKMVGSGHPVFVVAEAGINHGGDPQMCARMIEVAAASGADAVKLQTINADASYVKGTTSYAEFKGKEFSDEALNEMMHLADHLGIVLFSTPGDFESLDRIIRLEMPAIKISSGLMTNLPLVARAAASGLPLIISTGLAYAEEIDAVLETARTRGPSGISLLKCTALYPAPDDTINLAAIPAMAARYGVPIGYSDHTLDDLACIAAVALGATVIEKHFTLDSKLPGADHHISMEPEDFSRMVPCRGWQGYLPPDSRTFLAGRRQRLFTKMNR